MLEDLEELPPTHELWRGLGTEKKSLIAHVAAGGKISRGTLLRMQAAIGIAGPKGPLPWK
ncbi:MAG: hypothetical protein ABIG96_03190 [Candidatus Micrarchaeota archaeon]